MSDSSQDLDSGPKGASSQMVLMGGGGGDVEAVPSVYLSTAESGVAASAALQIVCQDLAFSIKVKDPKLGWQQKTILQGLTGIIQPGRLTAILGSSGAGKTTFLNVLAGYTQGEVTMSGCVSVNGEVVSDKRMRQISGFVHQEDSILGTMTVREALYMAARLRLPPHVPLAAKVRRAEAVALELNLTKAMDNIVGTALNKGVSGGEKRRVSLGMEMITNPSILYLDEPTSGLDTHTAHKVISILQNVAHEGRTIVTTIHQPSSDVFHMFDDLIVLADGQVMYHGLAEGLVSYFAALGYQCPQYTNPADFLFMDILNRGVLLEKVVRANQAENNTQVLSAVGGSALPGSASKAVALLVGDGIAGAGDLSADQLEAAQNKVVEDKRVRGLLSAWQSSSQNQSMLGDISGKRVLANGVGPGAVQYFAGFLTQLAVLILRAARNMWRNPMILKIKFFRTMILSVISGMIFYQLDNNLRGVQAREGALFLLMIQGTMGAVMGVVSVCGPELVVFKREFESRMYGLPAYFISWWAMDLPANIIIPIMGTGITYWMIGFQPKADKYLWYMLTMVLVNNCGTSLGMFVVCSFKDPSVAMAVMPIFIMPLMIFGGFFIVTSAIPVYLRWIQYISPVAQNEFSGLAIHCTPEQDCAPGYDGQNVIELLGLTQTVGENCAILFGLTMGLLVLAYATLWNTVRSLSK